MSLVPGAYGQGRKRKRARAVSERFRSPLDVQSLPFLAPRPHGWLNAVAALWSILALPSITIQADARRPRRLTCRASRTGRPLNSDPIVD